MKKKTGLLIAGVLIVCGIAISYQHCMKQSEVPPLEEVTYTNLAEPETQIIAQKVLAQAGVSESRRQRFLNEVNFFQQSVDRKFLTNGFETGKPTETKYDPYKMQEQWDRKNKDFQGYNCRITACSLMGDFIEANPVKNLDTDEIIFDLNSLRQDGRVLEEKDYNTFQAVFAGVVNAEKTKDVPTHVNEIQQAWKDRGVKFLSDPNKISMISVVFHTQLTEDDSRLFVGHVGVLVPKEDGGFYFIEKVAFQEPYRMNVFQNRKELSDYLMEKYDVEVGQPTSIPFIMENDKLMEGYRPNPNK